MQISHRLRRLAVTLLPLALCAALQPAVAAQNTQVANLVNVFAFGVPPEYLRDNVPRGVRGDMLLANDGNIYFTSRQGAGIGNIARLGPDGIVSVVYSFADADEGYAPFGGVIQASDGDLYGTTYYGGPDRRGTVFKVSLTGEFTQLHEFTDDSAGGQNPYTGLVQAGDGNLYGTTLSGGASDKGTIFRISTSGTFEVIHSFDGSDGSNPEGQLIVGSDGQLYGTTMLGGSQNRGVIYRISTAGEYEKLFSFQSLSAFNEFGLAINSSGANPRAGLLLGSDGSYYGTAYQGGQHGNGTFFRLTLSGDSVDFTTLHSFEGWAFDGGFPLSTVVEGADGNFYGTSEHGGYADQGAAWMITPDGSAKLLHGFINSATDGAIPYAGLLFANGTLYGVTSTDNTPVTAGAIFELKLGSGGVPPVVMTTSATTIFRGESIQIAWNAPGTVTCDKFGSWDEPTDENDPGFVTPISGTATLLPGTGVFTYGLACTDVDGVIYGDIVGVVVNPLPLTSVDGGAIEGGGDMSWLLLALLAALLFVKLSKETRSPCP